MQRQTGLTVISPANKPKNCKTWAEYEDPRVSTQRVPNTANLCNGGWYKGDFYEECESRHECTAATRAKLSGRRSLPTYGSAQTHAERPFGSQLLATTPNMSDMLKTDPWRPMPAAMPKSYVTQPGQNGQQNRPNYQGIPTPFDVAAPLPFPVQPPATWPQAMQTPYVGPSPVMTGGLTPTFLPGQNENPFGRLLRNIANGMVGAAGWQTFDMARSIDLFGPRR